MMSANEIRKIDALVHPAVAAVCRLIPGGAAVDAWLYGLIQTPGVLEQVLVIWPVKGPGE